MKKSLCEILLDYYPRNTEVEELYSTTIANCVFNCILSCTAIMFNIVTIHAIRRTSSLPKTLKTLLLSLAVSDVGVGLLGQPFYCLVLIKWSLQSNPDCTMFKAYYIVAYLFSCSFFLGCSGCKCGQVLSYSSSSQIPGTRDSQACCCCGDFNMDAVFNSSFFNVFGSARYLFAF